MDVEEECSTLVQEIKRLGPRHRRSLAWYMFWPIDLDMPMNRACSVLCMCRDHLVQLQHC